QDPGPAGHGKDDERHTEQNRIHAQIATQASAHTRNDPVVVAAAQQVGGRRRWRDDHGQTLARAVAGPQPRRARRFLLPTSGNAATGGGPVEQRVTHNGPEGEPKAAPERSTLDLVRSISSDTVSLVRK